MIEHDGGFQASKTRCLLYLGGNTVITYSYALDELTRNISPRWRLMVSACWLTTEVIALAQLQYGCTLAGGCCWKDVFRDISWGLSI